MIREISSSGYLRNRIPDDLIAIKKDELDESVDNSAKFAKAELVKVEETELLTEDMRKLAKIQGYEGDPCGECGNFTLVRNGTCMKCNTCGATSGCS